MKKEEDEEDEKENNDEDESPRYRHVHAVGMCLLTQQDQTTVKRQTQAALFPRGALPCQHNGIVSSLA